MASSGKSPQPPLLFLACLIAGWGLGLLHPLATGLPEAPRCWTAGGVLVLAPGLGTWGLLTFRRAGTTHEPNGQAMALLTTGPFRFSRNPLYLALTAFLAGFGLMLDSAWVLMGAPVLALLLDRLVIPREEARLGAQFGEAYQAYLRRVRRWL